MVLIVHMALLSLRPGTGLTPLGSLSRRSVSKTKAFCTSLGGLAYRKRLWTMGGAPRVGHKSRDDLPHITPWRALGRIRQVPKHVLATVHTELKRSMCELSGSDHAQLIHDATAHLRIATDPESYLNSKRLSQVP
jgi:hypothetical protein